MAPKWLKKLGKGAEIGAHWAAKLELPYADIVDSVIQQAKARGGSGQEKADFVLQELMGDGAGDIAAIEKELGREIPEAAAFAYLTGRLDIVKMQIELRYKLLKAAGVV